jgi:basic amino acid/polyamine antiporter, APA family
LKELERRLDLTAVVAISISAMLGSGIFVLPGIAFSKTGGSLWLAYLLAAICVLPAALSKAELGTAMPTSGGTYVYIDRTFGPLAGTIAGIGLWASLLLKSSFALLGFGAYLAILTKVNVLHMALVVLALSIWANILGVRRIGQIQKVVIGVAFVGMAVLLIQGLFVPQPQEPPPFLSDGSGGLFVAVAFVFVAYNGVTKVAAIAGEIKRPERNLPLGILLSLGIVTILYIGLSLLMTKLIPQEVFTSDLHPIYSIAQTLGGKYYGIPAAVIGVLVMSSMANAGLLAAARFPFAMARENLLPELFQRLHPKYLTPVFCTVVSGAFMALCLSLEIEKIAKLASSFVIMLYMAENITVIILRENAVEWYKPTYRSPLYPWTQILGTVSGLGLLVILGTSSFAAAVGVALPGSILYLLYGRHRVARRGVFGKKVLRREFQAYSEDAPDTVSLTDWDGDADVVVALFGIERSPEILVELGHALSKNGKVEVVRLADLPEQTALDAFSEDDPKIGSIRRRVLAMAEDQKIDLTFHAVASHDILQTVHNITDRLHCKMLVIEWMSRSNKSLTMYQPLGWLKDHLSCNLAVFSDYGIRYIRKILVFVTPGSNDTLVISTATRMAQLHKAELTFARVIDPAATSEHRQSEADYLDQLRSMAPEGVKTKLLEGKKPHLAIGEESNHYDMIITAEEITALWRKYLGLGTDLLHNSAACSVLRLQSPSTLGHERFTVTVDSVRPEVVQLVDVLLPNCIQLQIKVSKKEELFQIIARSFASEISGITSSEVAKALWERERTQNTAVGEGVALPHATVPKIDRTYLGIFTLSQQVAYGTRESEVVDVCFATIGPPSERNRHLALLAAISGFVRKPGLLEQLKGLRTKEELMSLVAADMADENGKNDNT